MRLSKIKHPSGGDVIFDRISGFLSTEKEDNIEEYFLNSKFPWFYHSKTVQSSEDTVFDDGAEDPNSTQAKRLYDAVKEMRFQSKEVSDPFANQLGEEVIDVLLSNSSVFAAFIHYALRKHSLPIPASAWKKHGLKPDEITQNANGLDLELKDIPLYISEHYGEDKDT